MLGLSSLKDIRAEKAQELIYKNGTAGVTKASVTLVWDNTDKSRSHIDFTDYDEITVERRIDIQKGSKNYINSKVATMSQIKDFFKAVKLNVDNPHFLIMQGRITKVINQKPLDTLHMIEEAAGTAMYQEKRLKAEGLIKKKDLKLEEINNMI